MPSSQWRMPNSCCFLHFCLINKKLHSIQTTAIFCNMPNAFCFEPKLFFKEFCQTANSIAHMLPFEFVWAFISSCDVVTSKHWLFEQSATKVSKNIRNCKTYASLLSHYFAIKENCYFWRTTFPFLLCCFRCHIFR